MTIKDYELIGAEVIGIDSGVYDPFGTIILRLTNGKFANISAKCNEGLFIRECDENGN